jgi:hypothetical protein
MLGRDLVTWVAYKNTGMLPQRIYSKGQDLSIGYDADPTMYKWLAHLTPKQCKRVEASLCCYRGY